MGLTGIGQRGGPGVGHRLGGPDGLSSELSEFCGSMSKKYHRHLCACIFYMLYFLITPSGEMISFSNSP